MLFCVCVFVCRATWRLEIDIRMKSTSLHLTF